MITIRHMASSEHKMKTQAIRRGLRLIFGVWFDVSWWSVGCDSIFSVFSPCREQNQAQWNSRGAQVPKIRPIKATVWKEKVISSKTNRLWNIVLLGSHFVSFFPLLGVVFHTFLFQISRFNSLPISIPCKSCISLLFMYSHCTALCVLECEKWSPVMP